MASTTRLPGSMPAAKSSSTSKTKSKSSPPKFNPYKSYHDNLPAHPPAPSPSPRSGYSPVPFKNPNGQLDKHRQTSYLDNPLPLADHFQPQVQNTYRHHSRSSSTTSSTYPRNSRTYPPPSSHSHIHIHKEQAMAMGSGRCKCCTARQSGYPLPGSSSSSAASWLSGWSASGYTEELDDEDIEWLYWESEDP